MVLNIHTMNIVMIRTVKLGTYYGKIQMDPYIPLMLTFQHMEHYQYPFEYLVKVVYRINYLIEL